MVGTDAPIALFEPILDDGIRAVNFFNGRLLAGGDLRKEQDARRTADARLGQASGPGIAWGLGVEISEKRVVKVFPGLAVSRAGQTLWLRPDKLVGLVTQAEATSTPASAGAFGACAALSGGTYVAGNGVYLLTIAPSSPTDGTAPVLALEPGNVRCNADVTVEAVQFRLIRIEEELLKAAGLDSNVVDDKAVSKLRNGVAYACFGAAALADAHLRPGMPPAGGLLQQLGIDIPSTCEVPLAIIFMTDSAGVVFVDAWSVRRRVATDSAAPDWSALVGERIDALAEAQLAQFQDQLKGICDKVPSASRATLAAKDWFDWLPPAGFLDGDGDNAVPWRTFLGDQLKSTVEVPLAPGNLRAVLSAALEQDPLRLADGLRCYRVYGITGSSAPARKLFVREAPNAVHAEGVWLDSTRAALPGVVDVQKAIDTLRRRSCDQVVLWPKDGRDGLGELKKQQDVVLCLERGTYREPIQLKGLGHVKIHGAGPGTRIVTKRECALLIEDCESVTVADLAVEAVTVKTGSDETGINGALMIRNTPSVRVERVCASCNTADKLAGAGIVVHNNKDGSGDTVAQVILCDNVVAPAEPGKGSLLRGIVVAGQAVADVVVRDNRVQLELTELTERDQNRNPFGMFIGDAMSVRVSGNRVLARLEGVGETAFEGLHLKGVYGQFIVVRDNHFDGCPIGIRFSAKDYDKERARLWVFQTNFAELLASGEKPRVLWMSEELLKLTIREHNQPE